ncbi:MAG: HEAT repeat domain-containing protein [Myxococcales bacterium]|nr:HEAT repeat domain-containing protein [Myxococcales bacterium]
MTSLCQRVLVLSSWALPAVLSGCPKSTANTFDPALPEQSVEVSSASPVEVLEHNAGVLDPSARARAVALLVAANHGPAFDARALGDPSPWVQRAAVEAMAARGDSDGAERLAEFTGRGDRDAFARALAAVRAPSPRAAAESAEAWQAEAAPWRRAPLALAALVNGDDAARTGLSDALATGELPLEADLMLEIGRCGDARLIPALQAAQEVVEEELDLAVAAARLMLGDPTAEQPFRKAVMGGDIERRLEALDYLVHIDAARTAPLLDRAMSQGPELVTAYARLVKAAQSGSDPAVFTKAAEDPDREVRELAVRFASRAAAGGTANKRVAKAVRDVIVDALADPSPGVRAEALVAVQRLAIPEAEPAVSQLLGDENLRVRIEAAGAALAL